MKPVFSILLTFFLSLLLCFFLPPNDAFSTVIILPSPKQTTITTTSCSTIGIRRLPTNPINPSHFSLGQDALSSSSSSSSLVLHAGSANANANAKESDRDSKSFFGLLSQENAKKVKSQLPNLLTILRVLSIPLFMLLFALRKKASTFLVFIFSCLTDWLDGYLARRWKQTSAFGAFLDPVADKLMVATALVLLASQYPTLLFALPASLILCREMAISALREWMASQGLRSVVQVGNLGKVKTALQMIAISFLLLVFPGQHSGDVDICALLGLPKHAVFLVGLAALYSCTVATIVSGWQYFHAAWPTLKKGFASSTSSTSTSTAATSSVKKEDEEKEEEEV